MSHQNKIEHLKAVRSYIRQFFVGGFKEQEDFIIRLGRQSIQLLPHRPAQDLRRLPISQWSLWGLPAMVLT